MGGIRDMNGIPDVMIIFDTNKEKNALEEAKVLNIPVVAVIDSNSNPDGIDFPIPGNDDATRALNTFCELISDTISMAVKNNIVKQTSDIGETDILVEDLSDLDKTVNIESDNKELDKNEVNKKNTTPTDKIK